MKRYIVVFLIQVFFQAAPVFAQSKIVIDDNKIIAAGLYGEAANDSDGIEALLNTYYKMKKPGETLAQSFLKNSCAVRLRSVQYNKVLQNKLNGYERKVYNSIMQKVISFRPASNWPYIHHENLKLYSSLGLAMRHLKKAWGTHVDYIHTVKIGKQTYFKGKND